MKAIIMAGGKGTRLGDVTKTIPKPMVKISGKPVLEHEIECLKQYGFTDIIITISYLGYFIRDYFGDGRKWGVNIEYFEEEKPLGNAGALFFIKDYINEDFLLINADSIFDINLEKFVSYHQKKKGLATLFTHPNNHPYDSGLIFADSSGRVTKWLAKEDERPAYYRNRVNAGIHILSPKTLDNEKIEKQLHDEANFKVDLDRDVLKPLLSSGRVFCYDSPEYVKDMGTPDRYQQVCDDFKSGLVHRKNLANKQGAIFLDRDGVINEHIGFLNNPDDFVLLPKVADAIAKINMSGYLVICVTNQPVIARGELTLDGLEVIHNKMEALLGKEHAYLDAIYYCPHHPDKGFKGEIPELKIVCDCRKPKAGMLLQAAKDYNIDLFSSWMIGDDERDIQAGKAAGCRTVFIGKSNCQQDITVNSLFDAVKEILGRGL